MIESCSLLVLFDFKNHVNFHHFVAYITAIIYKYVYIGSVWLHSNQDIMFLFNCCQVEVVSTVVLAAFLLEISL